MNTVFLVTNGEKQDIDSEGNWVPDPGMTEEGKERVKRLALILNDLTEGAITQICCGTGRRQWEVVEAMGLAHMKDEILFSSVFGDGAGLSRNKAEGKEAIVLTHGLTIKYEQYLSPRHMEKAVVDAIMELPHNSLICSGRPVLVRLRMRKEDAKSGAIYAITYEPGDPNSVKIILLVDGVNLLDGKGAAV